VLGSTEVHRIKPLILLEKDRGSKDREMQRDREKERGGERVIEGGEREKEIQ